MRRSPHGWRARLWSPACMTHAARHGSRRRSRDSLPVLGGAAAEAFEVGVAWRWRSRAGRRVRLRHGSRSAARAEPRAENWTTRRALLRSSSLSGPRRRREALEPMLAEVHQSGSASGLVARTDARLSQAAPGALPEADAATRVALRVLREGDFAPRASVRGDHPCRRRDRGRRARRGEGGACAASSRAMDAGPRDGVIPRHAGRLRLAQGRAVEALSEFEACAAMSSPEVWGVEIGDKSPI